MLEHREQVVSGAVALATVFVAGVVNRQFGKKQQKFSAVGWRWGTEAKGDGGG